MIGLGRFDFHRSGGGNRSLIQQPKYPANFLAFSTVMVRYRWRATSQTYGCGRPSAWATVTCETPASEIAFATRLVPGSERRILRSSAQSLIAKLPGTECQVLLTRLLVEISREKAAAATKEAREGGA